VNRRFVLNLAALAFGFLIGAASTWASAVEGYMYKDKCHEQISDAVQSFASGFPQVMGPNMVIYAQTTFMQQGNPDFLYDAFYYDSQGQWVPMLNNAGAFQICTVPEDVSSLVPNNFILIVACVILWAIGFSIGMKR